MKENYFLLFLFQLLVAFAQAQRPNIIYIMSDDMGYGDLSCYGQKKFSTPNLDRLASQGMKFTQAYAAGALCTPTRASFFTGRYPQRTPVGLMEPLIPRKRDSVYGLSADYPSIATLMKQAGYETVLIGKWHLGWLAQHSPLKNGFDYFFGIQPVRNGFVGVFNRLPYSFAHTKSNCLSPTKTSKAFLFCTHLHGTTLALARPG
jgi:arylsulfatase A-like enzyme